jgi:hypothetical protein
MGMSLKQLLNSAWPQDKTNAREVRLVQYKYTPNLKLATLHTVTHDLKKQEKRLHRQRVIAADRKYHGTINKCPALILSCDCARFLFYYEVALKSRGAANIVYSNGENPSTTNPHLKPGICKHLIVVLNYMERHHKTAGKKPMIVLPRHPQNKLINPKKKVKR